jgi:hypothetical protein
MQLSADAIWLATAAVDMRTGIDGLSLHVKSLEPLDLPREQQRNQDVRIRS